MRRIVSIFTSLISLPAFANCRHELQLTAAKQTLTERREFVALIGMRLRGEAAEIEALCDRLDQQLAHVRGGAARETEISMLMKRAECLGEIVAVKSTPNLRARSLLDHPAFGVEVR